MIFLFLAAVVLSFLLSGLETAMLSVSRVRVRHSATAGDKRAKRLLTMLDDRDGLIGALTVANHIANVGAFSYITWRLVHSLQNCGYVVGFLLTLPIFILGLELLPKNLFRRYPFRALVRLLPLLSIAWWFRGLFKTIPTPPGLAEPPVASDQEQASRDDVTRLIREMSLSEKLPTSVSEIVERVLSSRPLTARELLVPLDQTLMLSADGLASDALTLAHKHRQSCLLIIEPQSQPEKPVFQGLIDVTTLPPKLPLDRQNLQHTRPLERVDASATALYVLQRLRRKGASLALVTEGPDHSPVGIITEEDIIARLLPVRK